LAGDGGAICHTRNDGLPYEIDKTKPKVKHAPKEAHRRTKIGPYAAAAVRLLILTGARLREILHLKWDHVDLDRGLYCPTARPAKRRLCLT
jgi:integrase